MGNITQDKLLELLEKFYEEYKKNDKFLLFSLANANENAHTKVLKYLLEYNKHQFLSSFLKKVDLPNTENIHEVSINGQMNAIGPKATGYMDLYISYGGTRVIIENKIYGAADTDKQLARYYATAMGIKNNDDFKEWCKRPYVAEDKNIYVIYLTADGTKKPNENSLPDNLKNYYYAINYKDDILPWLEEEVLPQLTYATDGMMIAGVLQYIAYLKQFLAKESSAVINQFVKNLGYNPKEKYEDLLSIIDKKNKKVLTDVQKSLCEKLSVSAEEIETVQKSFCRQIETCAEEIFSADVEGEWVLHFTRTYIVLYKKSWAALDTRKYSIPSLYIYAGNTSYFLKNGCFEKLNLAVDHLSPEAKNNFNDFKFGNHDKNIGFPLGEFGKIKCENINDADERKEFYNNVIGKIEDEVNIDDMVALLQNSVNPITPDKILDKVVDLASSQKIKVSIPMKETN